MTIAERRLRKQHIATRGLRRPQDVVAWFGAMQAQEYEPAKWAIGLRMPDGTTSAKVQRACDEGRILRTHVMRPTWHFVAAADIRWLLELTAPRVHRILSYYNRGTTAPPRFTGASGAHCSSSTIRTVRRAACHVLGRC